MADQATMTNNPGAQNHPPSADGIVENVTEFGGNLITLVELQAQLALRDAQEGVDRAILPVAFVAVGAALALASLPVLLIAAGLLLAAATGWNLGPSLLLCGVVALIVGTSLAFLCGRRVGGCFASFDRSRDEFHRNLAWVKTALSRERDSTRRRV